MSEIGSILMRSEEGRKNNRVALNCQSILKKRMTGGNIHGRTETALEKSVLGVVLLIILGIIVYRRQFIPVSVPVTQAVKGTMVQGIVGTGTLQARVRVAIGANISGRVAPW